jgi:uncharacterized membrane protein required for colicin V production
MSPAIGSSAEPGVAPDLLGSRTSGMTPWRSSLTILLAGVLLFAVSHRSDFHLGEIAAPLLTLGALHGLWRGGFRKIVMIAATIGALYMVAVSSERAGAAIRAVTGAASEAWGYLATIAAAVAALLIVGVLVKSIRKRVILRHGVLRLADRLLGVAVGLVEAALVVLAICWTVVAIRPHTSLIRDHQATQVGSLRHRVAEEMVRLADEADAGALGRAVSATNPIDQIPALRRIIDDLNATGELRLENLNGLDPQTIRRLSEILKQTPVEDLGGLNDVIERYKQGDEARDRAYRQLPSHNPPTHQ